MILRKVAFLLLVSTSYCYAEPLLLTGQVEDVNAQNLVTPWTNSWRTQVKWMVEEGKIVEQGDTIVIFDTSNLDAEIEQKENQLRQAEQKAKQEIDKKEREYREAEFDQQLAQLRLEKARVEAEVPKSFRSDYEYAQFQFELMKAKDEYQRAKEAFELKKKAFESEKTKQQLIIEAAEKDLNISRLQLESLSLKAKFKGAVFYATHPWHGTKIQPGSDVQTSMIVAKVSSDSDLKVTAWVNEVDWPKVKEGDEVSLYFDAFLNQKFKGVIESLGTQSSVKSLWGEGAWYEVTVNIEGASDGLAPGMSALVLLGDEA